MQTLSLQTPYLRAGYAFNIGHIHIHTVQGRVGLPWKPQSKNRRQGGGHGLETAGLSSVHLLEKFVSGIFVAVILHLIELPLLWSKHRVDLYYAMADGSIRLTAH